VNPGGAPRGRVRTSQNEAREAENNAGAPRATAGNETPRAMPRCGVRLNNCRTPKTTTQSLAPTINVRGLGQGSGTAAPMTSSSYRTNGCRRETGRQSPTAHHVSRPGDRPAVSPERLESQLMMCSWHAPARMSARTTHRHTEAPLRRRPGRTYQPRQPTPARESLTAASNRFPKAGQLLSNILGEKTGPYGSLLSTHGLPDPRGPLKPVTRRPPQTR